MRSYFKSALAGLLAIGLAAGCQSPGPPKKKEASAAPPSVEVAEEAVKTLGAAPPGAGTKAGDQSPEPGPVMAEPSGAAAQAQAPAREEAPPAAAMEKAEPEAMKAEESEAAPEKSAAEAAQAAPVQPAAGEPEVPAAAVEEKPEPEVVKAGEPEAAPGQPAEAARPAAEAPKGEPSAPATIRGAKPALSADKLKARVNYLESLVYKSSSAKKVEEGGNEEAKATLARSRALYEEAKAAIDGGDLEKADEAMRESMRLVGVASRLAASPEEEAAREREKYAQTRKSVASFLEAIDRVVKENGAEKKDLGVDPAPIHKLVDEAEKLAGEGKAKEANVKMNEAYTLASAAVAKLRDKETILLTLDFATPEDEYKYVLGRNESYESLVNVMTHEKQPDEAQMAKIGGYVKESKSILAEAKKLAGKGDFEQAIKVAEQATKELAKALRALGLMVFD